MLVMIAAIITKPFPSAQKGNILMAKQKLMYLFFHKSVFIALIAVTFSSQWATSKTSETKMQNWFTTKNCQKIEFIKYKSVSEHTVVNSVSIQDAAFIDSFMDRIEKVPANGDIMVSFAENAAHTELNFICGDQKKTIDIYNRGFKTPSTGFNSNNDENEKALIRDIEALLEPAFGKMTPKIKDLEVKFEKFSIIYQGRKETSGGPTSLNFTNELFLVKDSKGNEQTLEVTSGQLPPAPKKFTVEGSFLEKFFPSKFTLETYQTASGDRLYPDYFQILKLK